METKIMVVGSCKTTNENKRRPRIRISGFWLADIGFAPDTLVSCSSEQGKLVFEAQGFGMETYLKVAKEVLKSGSRLLQVKNELHNKKRTPHFEVKGEWLKQSGFPIGQVIAVQWEYGRIVVRALDIEKLIKQQEGF